MRVLRRHTLRRQLETINPRNASKVKSRNYRGTLTRRDERNPFDNETRFLEREISKEETGRGKKEIVTKDAALSLSRNDISQVFPRMK